MKSHTLRPFLILSLLASLSQAPTPAYSHDDDHWEIFFVGDLIGPLLYLFNDFENEFEAPSRYRYGPYDGYYEEPYYVDAPLEDPYRDWVHAKAMERRQREYDRYRRDLEWEQVKRDQKREQEQQLREREWRKEVRYQEQNYQDEVSPKATHKSRRGANSKHPGWKKGG